MAFKHSHPHTHKGKAKKAPRSDGRRRTKQPRSERTGRFVKR